MLVYQEPSPISRAGAEAALASGEAHDVCRALVSAAFHDPDWRWVQERCLECLEHSNTDVRRLAATCLGHIARIHGQLDEDRVLTALRSRLHDPEIGGSVGDALGNIDTFIHRFRRQQR